MNTVKYAYEDVVSSNKWDWIWDVRYEDLITRNGEEILLAEDDNHCSGDSLLILRHPDGRYGYLTYGWGTCSGCDALMGCNSLQDLHDLAADLERSVVWRDTAKELHDYLAEKDFTTEWISKDLVKRFLPAALKLLRQ